MDEDAVDGGRLSVFGGGGGGGGLFCGGGEFSMVCTDGDGSVCRVLVGMNASGVVPVDFCRNRAADCLIRIPDTGDGYVSDV